MSYSALLLSMQWNVEFDKSFAAEARAFEQPVKEHIAALVKLLQQCGPQLQRPRCDTLKGSQYANMKELRFSLPDGEWRIAFAFDTERTAILLVGGSKSGVNEKRFYRTLIRTADQRFSRHLENLRRSDGGT